jgi:hypothetical protein
VYAPTKEIVRHYEGYSHVNDNMAQTLENVSPPLFIPPGFFENDIKIAIGFYERDDSWTNFNPAAEWLYNAKTSGTDYRWVEEDIPLFWRLRIGKITHSPEYDQQAMRQARDTAMLVSTHVPMKEEFQSIVKIVPQRFMNSYNYQFYHYSDHRDKLGIDGNWQIRDWLIHWPAISLEDRLNLTRHYEPYIIY